MDSNINALIRVNSIAALAIKRLREA
jgi:hypothetical protein